MKTVLVAFLLLAALEVRASSTPFGPEVEARFKALEITSVGGALADGYTVFGSALGVATAVQLSGDVTATNAGVTAIGAGKVTQAMLVAPTADGLHAKRIARATLNCAAAGCAVGAHTLGVTLPAKALITRSWIYVVTQLTDTGTCTVALSCEDANNIKTATDISGSAAGAFIEGESTGAASAFVGGIASACLITATVADGGSCVPITGKVIAFVEYSVGE